ncbi:MAG: helix-turn-helix domain-containing protein [Niveispirillum sp.]|uniref:helix-turn-helix domain-containing protein n=1 Tax=Niveispirillum sp. TaxID=1917217 RepID=UPI00403565F4
MDAKVSVLDLQGPREALRGEIAQRLQGLMEKKGWNQSELARAAGIGRDSVSVYCLGKSIPGAKHLAAMARALNCDPSDICPAVSEASAPTAMQVTQVVGEPGKAWLRLNRSVTMDQLVRIMQILAEPET